MYDKEGIWGLFDTDALFFEMRKEKQKKMWKNVKKCWHMLQVRVS